MKLWCLQENGHACYAEKEYRETPDAQCKQWAHKWCSGNTYGLTANLGFICTKCTGALRFYICARCGRALSTEVIQEIKFLNCSGSFLEVNCFYCKSDPIVSSTGYWENTKARVRTGWKIFRECLSLRETRASSTEWKCSRRYLYRKFRAFRSGMQRKTWDQDAKGDLGSEWKVGDLGPECIGWSGTERFGAWM